MKKEEKRFEVKQASFMPDLCDYKPSSNVNTKQIKGVQQHMNRILEAKKRKIEEA